MVVLPFLTSTSAADIYFLRSRFSLSFITSTIYSMADEILEEEMQVCVTINAFNWTAEP